jgi:hypothetical protein
LEERLLAGAQTSVTWDTRHLATRPSFTLLNYHVTSPTSGRCSSKVQQSGRPTCEFSDPIRASDQPQRPFIDRHATSYGSDGGSRRAGPRRRPGSHRTQWRPAPTRRRRSSAGGWLCKRGYPSGAPILKPCKFPVMPDTCPGRPTARRLACSERGSSVLISERPPRPGRLDGHWLAQRRTGISARARGLLQSERQTQRIGDPAWGRSDPSCAL